MSLFSRVLLVLVCAAVVPSSIMGPHAAKAYPKVAPSGSGEQPFLRSYKHFGLLSSAPGHPSETSSETAYSWRDPDRDAPPVPNLQLNTIQKEHLGYNTNNWVNQPYLEQMTLLHRGQHLSEAKPASGTSSHSDPQLSRMNHYPFLHVKTQDGGPSGFVASHNGNWHLPIIRKSSEQGWPFPQRSALEAQKANTNYHIPRSGTSTQPESRSEDKIDWQSPGNSPASFQSSGYWSSQTHTKGLSSDNEERQAGASAVHGGKFPSFLNRKSFIPPSVSSSKESSVAKPEKLTSPITHISQGEFPPKSNEKTSYKRVQSSLLRNSHISDTLKGVNTPNFQYNAYQGQDFDQQTSSNSKSASKGDHPAYVIYRAPTTNTLTPFEDTDTSSQPNENGQLKESFILNKKPASWSSLMQNSQPSINSKEATLESINYRLIRPTSLQKYSFEQRIAPMLSSHEKISEHSSSELLVTTTAKSSTQEYGSQSTSNLRVKKSTAFSGIIQNEENNKPLTMRADTSKLISTTRIKPHPKNHRVTKEDDNVAKDFKYKAIIYDDIIGSASFSSVTPAETVMQMEHTDAMDRSVKSSEVNGTEENSVGGGTFDFSKGEADSELRRSDWSASGEEREAKSVPRGLPSDSEEDIEGDSLLELDYLRTSTGNVSFQSLNLNL